MSLLSGPNPVLTRELRASLRNARAFGLIAVYVALLGAIVVAQFPGDQSLDLQAGGDGGKRGLELFYWFIGGQAFLILMLLPALATGALAQERERRTLEPLLLSPMTPLQIVWGKAGGVLSLVCLLLISTLPLTSLCFLLGGVSPGELIGWYASLLGLAVFTTGLGLYCSARWPGATRAMIYCYGLLPVAIALVVVFLPLGSLFSGLFVLFMSGYGIVNMWKMGSDSKLSKALGPIYRVAIIPLMPVLLIALIWFSWSRLNLGYIVFGVGFVFSYLLLAAQWGMLQTARELMQRADPEAPMRQKIADFKDDWQRALAPQPVYLPDPRLTTSPVASTEPASPMTVAAPRPATAPATTPSTPTRKKAEKDTYGKVPFLSDRLNPIYAKELRSGMLGKFEYLFRLSYIITILTEVGLLGLMLLGLMDGRYLTIDFEGYFGFWGVLHLGMVVIFGAWFGARAIAPEREGQTLVQLFTIPLQPLQIIQGKTAAVLTFTLYVWILAVPLALLMAILGLIPWMTALQFLIVEAVIGTLSAAWGVYCSFHGGTVRRALSMALGGAAVMILAHNLIYPLWDVLRTLKLVKDTSGAEVVFHAFPIPMLLPPRESNTSFYVAVSRVSNDYWVLTLVMLLVYAVAAIVMLALTARNFRKYAQTV